MKKEEKKSIFGKNKKEIRNKLIVNLVTAIRSLGTVAIVPIFLSGGAFKTAIATICFFATDFIDGFLARHWHAQSFFGSLLDGLSDKAFGIVCLLLLGTLNPIFFVIPLIELGILAVNYKSIQRGNNAQSSKAGKAKTVLLAASIVGGFFSYATPSIKEILNYINVSSLDTIFNTNPDLLSTIFAVPAIAASLYVEKDYLDKAKKQDIKRNQDLTEQAVLSLGSDKNNLTIAEIEAKKEELRKQKEEILVLKNREEIIHDLFDTNFYLEHRDDGIKRLLYKNKGSE